MRTHASALSRSAIHGGLALAAICAFVLALAFSSQASAAQFQRKETFGSAAQPSLINPAGLAVDASSGDLLVLDLGNNTISRFHPDGTPADFSALGTNVIDGIGGADETPQEGLTFGEPGDSQVAVDNSGSITDGDIYVTNGQASNGPGVISIFSSSGEYLGELSEFPKACGVAVDPSGNVFVGAYASGIYKFSPSANPPTNADFVTTFPQQACTLAAGTGPTAGALFLQDNGLFVKQNSTTGVVEYTVSAGFAYIKTVASGTGYVLRGGGGGSGESTGDVFEYDASGPSRATQIRKFNVGSSVLGLAVAPSGEIYVARQGAPLEVWGPVPAAAATATAATNVTRTGATINGLVNAEGLPVTECKFEYGVNFEKEAPCNPSAAQLNPDFSNQAVSTTITGLQENTTYHYRLVVADSVGTETSPPLDVTTLGRPQVSEVRALNATQGSVTIEAKVNPSGFGTSYRFEWGPTDSYGNQVPAELEPYLGEGTKPVRVSARLNGLAEGAKYHYRLVAGSSAGTTTTTDQIVETLNSCGLPEDRCFELVSRREAGPVAVPGETFSPSEMHFQAATTPGALAYVVEAGYLDATKAGEVLYRGTRGPSGWDSTQLSGPIVALNEQAGVGSVSSNTQFLSNNLSCGFLESTQPLTDDPSTRLVIEDGGSNLYRINPDGSYSAVSKLAPENSGSANESGRGNYTVLGASQDCSKVLFSSTYLYPGIAGKARLYEWDEGTLRNVGVVPGPGGEEVAVGASASVGQGSVSEDGSRAFFSAERQASPNPEEIGKKAIFVREDGGANVRDISLSQTGTPDKGATYQWVTPDGAHVFFTANAGLTDESSPAGTDLYEYNLETEELVDRSVSQVEGGTRVSGFFGAANDGSRVYFASQAQLVPGRGNTQAENKNIGTTSIYSESSAGITFAGTIREADLERVTVGVTSSARVSPDGRYLLFPSSANVTGYQSGGSAQAYLYDASGGSEGTICVSCRQDGQLSVSPSSYEVLSEFQAANSPLHPLQFLVMHEGEPRVFFNSPDALAPGAVEGQNNVYEWAHGQVFRLTSAVEEQSDPPFSGYGTAFAGASADGSDIYFFTPRTLNWEDGDERFSVYDARAGGGFPEPPPAPEPCEATTEGSCQGQAQGAPSVSGAASASFNGPGNPPDQSTKKKSKKKPHKKKQKHAKKKKGKSKKQARQANGNRRAGK